MSMYMDNVVDCGDDSGCVDDVCLEGSAPDGLVP